MTTKKGSADYMRLERDQKFELGSKLLSTPQNAGLDALGRPR